MDDRTWDDFDMNSVYSKLDRTYSSPGEEVLYHMLRNPIMEEDELRRRDKVIQNFKNNRRLRERLQCIFFNLNKNQLNTFLDMVDNNLIINSGKYYLYTLLGKVLPLMIIIASIFINTKYMFGLLILSGLNMLINSSERNVIKSNGIFYLRKLIKSAKKIENINDRELIYYSDKISAILNQIKIIDRNTRFIGFVNMWVGIFEA